MHYTRNLAGPQLIPIDISSRPKPSVPVSAGFVHELVVQLETKQESRRLQPLSRSKSARALAVGNPTQLRIDVVRGPKAWSKSESDSQSQELALLRRVEKEKAILSELTLETLPVLLDSFYAFSQSPRIWRLTNSAEDMSPLGSPMFSASSVTLAADSAADSRQKRPVWWNLPNHSQGFSPSSSMFPEPSATLEDKFIPDIERPISPRSQSPLAMATAPATPRLRRPELSEISTDGHIDNFKDPIYPKSDSNPVPDPVSTAGNVAGDLGDLEAPPSGLPVLAPLPDGVVPDLPSGLAMPVDITGTLDPPPLPKLSKKQKCLNRGKKAIRKGQKCVRKCRGGVLREPVLAVVLGRQLAKPTAKALKLLANDIPIEPVEITSAVVPEAATSGLVPLPLPV
ncbi:uncharacterized protein L3040_008881 [Drepanopeziza brunnea f. sp. 'multigermtubi']|nr:hypothetical protein L3040_008881 [Drepanopeziza brunnea f. sp. 'multigermtubi']